MKEIKIECLNLVYCVLLCDGLRTNQLANQLVHSPKLVDIVCDELHQLQICSLVIRNALQRVAPHVLF